MALSAAQLISRDALYPTRRSSVCEPAILPRRLTAVGGDKCRSAYLRRGSNNKIQIDCNIRPLPEFVNDYFPDKSRQGRRVISLTSLNVCSTGSGHTRNERVIASIVFQSKCLIYLYFFGSVRKTSDRQSKEEKVVQLRK